LTCAIDKLLNVYFSNNSALSLILIEDIKVKPIQRPSTMLLIVEEVYKHRERSRVELLVISFRFNTYIYTNIFIC